MHAKELVPQSVHSTSNVSMSFVILLTQTRDKEHAWLTAFTENEETKCHVIVVCGVSIVLDQSYSLLHSIHSVNRSDFHTDILFSHVLRP